MAAFVHLNCIVDEHAFRVNESFTFPSRTVICHFKNAWALKIKFQSINTVYCKEHYKTTVYVESTKTEITYLYYSPGSRQCLFILKKLIC
jgi:hypothetical protein